jgi:hypothetical protein
MKTLGNVRKDGATELFNNLCFHGGDRLTLEMCRFSLPGVLAELTEASFKSLREQREDVPKYGIIYGT